MPTQDEAMRLYQRYGQWCSYVIQLKESMEKAQRLLPLAQTPEANALQARVIAICQKHLAEMEQLFPDVGP